MYEEEQPGVLYNTAAVIDADGTYLGKYRKTPHPAGQGLLGEVLLPARQPRLPGLRHRGRQDRRLHLLRPALPGGLAGARPRRAPRSSSTRRPPVARPVRPTCGSWSSRPRPWPTSTSSARSTGSGIEDARRQRLLRHVVLRRPARASSSARSADDDEPSSSSATWTWACSPRSATAGQFYRDRRPDAYGPTGAVSVRRHSMTTSSAAAPSSPPTGEHAADVLDRGRPDRRPRRPGHAARPSRGRPTGHRRHRQVRHPRRRRRAHPHGAAVRRHLRLRHLRDRHPGRRLGRHHHHRRLRRPARRPARCATGSTPGTPRPTATAPSTTAST